MHRCARLKFPNNFQLLTQTIVFDRGQFYEVMPFGWILSDTRRGSYDLSDNERSLAGNNQLAYFR